MKLWAERQRELSVRAVVVMKKCGDHEIFITKFGIFSDFMKILKHENLELYGTCPLLLESIVSCIFH